MANRVYAILVVVLGGLVLLAALSWLGSLLAGCISVDRPALIQVNIGGREVKTGGETKSDLPTSLPADYQAPAEILDEVLDDLFQVNTEANGTAPCEP